MSTWKLCVAALGLTVLLQGNADAAAPVEITELRVMPEQIRLQGARDEKRFVVQARLSDGSTRDVTSAAKFSVKNTSIATLVGTVVTPAADGTTELAVTHEGRTVRATIDVEAASDVTPLSFRNDILPILTKTGCNAGRCHGAGSGKDGFRLSLYGFDPQGDHYRLTREFSGRRIDLASPENCLLVAKATGAVDHTGGQCIVEGSFEHEQLLAWLKNGAPNDNRETPVPTGITVFPRQAVFAKAGEKQGLVVIAMYSDGTQRDVTDLAVFLSNNDAAATVSEQGIATSTGPGNAFILARFDQFTEGAALTTRPGTEYPGFDLKPQNEIDRHVFARWNDMHIVPSDLCSDEVFLRRATLDLTGLLPTPEKWATFLADTSSDKRSHLVDELIETRDFQDMWIMRWAELLQIRTSNGISRKGLHLYDQWLRERVHAGETIDKIVAEALSATGGTFENPASSYFQTETTPQLLAENAAQAFLGTRIQCAQCHNHPFDRWTMDDYYGFAEFFAQVGYKQAQDPREITVFNAGMGSLKHPVDGRDVVLRHLGGEPPAVKPGEDYRKVLAEWLASPENPSFSRNVANVVWAHFLGVGVVEPVDDFRVSNPPSNPALLDHIGRKLAGDRFNIRPLVREICNSRTYQLASTRNASNAWDMRNFSHARIRRLRAEVLLDCLNQVTATTERLPGLPAGGRAIEVADGQVPNYFLTTFGRSDRATACTCEVQKTSPTLSQALHLINGEATSGKIAQGKVIERLITTNPDSVAIVTALYERCLGRAPRPEEQSAIQAKLASSEDAITALTDLFWALLNSNEFVFNH
ncbi:hypothetical protein Pan44_10720 [Caulifigura coniformis]|uniref:BIG2 domain-containing protein n=2 Tax=Caulifigura coniformis TaxID=2527983 RepID=A0A517SAA3_9PLAN|nr:hypothetical protein Pan44_10720 [Caulifigura coniformis]